MRAVERAAGEAFRTLGMASIADDEPASAAEFAGYVKAGTAWVATNEDDQPVGYLILDELDGCAHIEQVTVHPSHSRQGLGASLIDRAAEWAEKRRLDGLTLTTFANVPWNAPYYARLGFTVVPEPLLSVGLRDQVAREAAHGLNRWPRAVMARANGR